ncbi:endothelial PAS domain-containing protein 1-like isoform X2 [Narcine bancroftii]|uniref:endothelial PAS domain-containing protein 1-like isoform X2 n=1 Tax=Narcine bancroftii TaxID=1343680 RepID=UPI0038312B07
MGQNALDFVHPCDHQELQEALETETDGDDRGRKRDFLIRLKCTVTDQGRVVNLKSAWWKVVRCQGQMRTTTGTRCLLLLCEDVALPLGLAGPPQTNSFLSMHSLDLTIIHCSRSVKHLIGWEAGQLIGRSTYHLLHALDLKHIWKQHHSLLKMGRVSSGLYRMLLHTGGYVWVQTEAAVVNAHTPHIVCANHILSGPQQQGVVFSLEQLQPHHPSVVWTAETTIPNGSFLTGPPQDLRQAAGVWQEWLWPAQTRELSGMSCPEPHPYLPEGPVNGPWTQKHPATVLGVGRGLETIPSPASRALRPEAVFTVQDLDTLAPFIPMEDQDFQPHPVANPQLLQAPGGQTLSQRTSRHPLGRTWESSTQPGLKRKHRTRGNYDWASCQYDHCQGFHHQKRLKVLGELGAVRSSHCRWSPWDSWRGRWDKAE